MNAAGWEKNYWRPFLKERGIYLRFHDLRHLHGILLRRQGLDLDHVQEQMRHASISTTFDIYGDIDKNELLKRLDGVDEYIRSLREKREHRQA
jgi:integrase